jgi:hypothetical protein
MQTVSNGDQLKIRDTPVLIFNAGNDALIQINAIFRQSFRQLGLGHRRVVGNAGLSNPRTRQVSWNWGMFFCGHKRRALWVFSQDNPNWQLRQCQFCLGLGEIYDALFFMWIS